MCGENGFLSPRKPPLVEGMIWGKYFYPNLVYLCAHLIPCLYAYMKNRLESNNFVTVL